MKKLATADAVNEASLALLHRQRAKGLQHPSLPLDRIRRRRRLALGAASPSLTHP